MHFFQLYMFDFDGLLVDTERGHYEAYRRMCAGRGIQLAWDFPTYCTIAHYSSDGLEKRMYNDYPELYAMEPNWNVLYKEKSQAIMDLYHEGAIELMPGVEELLTELDELDIPRCVVTHSALELVDILRKQHKIFDTVPHWITRKDYSKAKPDPESYKVAMEKLLPSEGIAIGFEDSIRGLRALMGSGAKPVLVTTMDYPEISDVVNQGVLHLKTLKDKDLLVKHFHEK
jgi:beta-phosphoglucomutase